MIFLNKLTIIKILSFLVMAASLLVIIGWIFDIVFLKSIYPSWVAMKFITALAFLLSGSILYIIAKTREWRMANEIVPLLSVVIILIMITLLIAFIFGIHTGIEDLFVREDAGAIKTIIPGSPAIPTMIAFILVAVSGFLCFVNYEKFRKLVIVSGGAIATIGVIAVVGYIFQIPLLYYYIPGKSGAIAVLTAILFIIIGISMALMGKVKFEEVPIKENKKNTIISIKFRILFSFLSIGLASTVFLGYVSIRSFENVVQNEISNRLLLLAEAKEGQVYAYLDFLKSRTLDFSSDGFIRDGLEGIKKNNSAEIVKGLNLHLQSKKSLDQSIAGIMLVDSEGKVVASTDEKEVGKSESEDDYFILGKKKVSFFQEREGSIHFGVVNPFIVSAPIKDNDSQEFLGLIVNVFTTDKLADTISGKYQLDAGASTSELTRLKTQEVYLVVNKDKKMFLHPQLNFKEKSGHYAGMEVDTLPVKKCLENNKEIAQVYQNYAKEEVVGASMCFSQYGWTLLIEVSTAEAFAQMKSMEFGLIVFIIVLLLFVAIYAFIAGSKISQPIKVLRNAIEIISQGNLDYEVKIGTGDEIEQLGNAFNDMASKLKESYSRLEEKVKEQTSEISKQLAEIEKKNVFLEDTKRAVLNILEDDHELEEQLKQEKACVEKKVEERTKLFYEEKAKLQASINSLNIGLIMTDMHNHVLIMNFAARKILSSSASGKTLQENGLQAHLPSSVNVNLDLSHIQHFFVGIIDLPALVAQCMREKKSLEVKELSFGSRILHISVEPILAIQNTENIQGENLGVIIVLGDITERKILERSIVERTKELSEEQARLQASINSLTRGFIMVDNKHNILSINKAAKETLHLGNENPTIELIQKQLQDKLDIVSQMVKCLGTHTAIDLKEVLFGNQYLRIFMTPIVLEPNNAIGVVILVEDITEEKAIERSKDEFFSIASHELRTPLTAIRGNVSLIQQYYADKLSDPELKEMIGDIHESSTRLINIVNDFLNTSRLEMGKMQFKKETFDMVLLIRDVIKEYMTTGSMKNVGLQLEEPSVSLPQAIGDSDRVKQVLINLVGNALKFTEKGGVTIRVAKNDNALEIFVSDTGKGVPLENQSLLFHKFQQAGASLFTRDAVQGTGLGLYISKMMMEGMGGKIWLASSELNKGTTFVLSLPAAVTQE